MNALEQALADIRAIPSAEPATEPTDPGKPTCCTGDRRGYQLHQRTGTPPACDEARAAQRIYQQERRALLRAGGVR